MKWLKSLHVISRESDALIYDPRTYGLVRVSKPWGPIIEAVLAKNSLEQVGEEHGLDVSDIEEGLEGLKTTLEARPNTITDLVKIKDPTVYLHVSNACNLACVYCYANGGSYNSPPGVMSVDLAKLTVDRFFESFERIGTVVFFGGEPLLQASMIPEVCDYVLEAAKRRNVEPPQFSIVTNGTLLNESNVAILKKYGFSATVSIDGPAEIHDLLRPNLKGLPSFSKVSDGLWRLKEAGVRAGVEVTFTALHFRMGIRPKELLEYFRDKYEIRSLTLAVVSAIPGQEVSLSDHQLELIESYREATRYSMESLKTDRPILFVQAREALKYLLTNTRRPTNQFCYTNLGEEHFSVSSKGNIYPCQMMNDQEKNDMGSIHDPNFRETESFKNVREKFSGMDKMHMQCKNCWAKELCFICVAGVEIETGKLAPIPKHRCDMVQSILEEVLSHVADAKRDPATWDLFCRNALYG